MTNPSRFRRDYLPLIAWLAVIFCASTSAGSAAHTLGLLTRIVHALFGGWVGPAALDTIDYWVRKSAHLTEYAILGILFYRSYRTDGVAAWQRRPALWAWASATLYAATDEFHQAFVPGRTSCAGDAVIDSCGAAIGLLLFKLRAESAPPALPAAALPEEA